MWLVASTTSNHVSVVDGTISDQVQWHGAWTDEKERKGDAYGAL